MSGGSWDYLCHKEVDELIGRVDMLQDMADRLASLGYANDAAKETQELVLTIRQFVNHAGCIKDRLDDIWRSIEWWDSCDYGESQVKDAVEKYREKAARGPNT